MINAVMLGAVAASGRLPIPAEAFEEAIRAGKSADANLRGFKAGFDAARQDATVGPHPASNGAPPSPKAGRDSELEREAARFGAATDFVTEGLRRLTAYQDVTYAKLYLDRLAPIADADARAGAQGRLTREVARHLALRMSYQDVIRVAQAKIAPERIAKIVDQMGAKPGEPVTIVEFLKPGIEEMCSILPPRLARRIIAIAERRGWIDRFHWGMEIKTNSVSGYLRFLMLAKLRRFRPRSYRFAQEQAAIEAWLALIVAAAAKSAPLALEVTECARLIKGYGDTLRRGAANYAAIERQVIRPILAGTLPLARGVDAIASARMAALTDPDGETLAKCLAEIGQLRALDVAAE
jgi:indolepyruvate ferredoxin oxidoreductase beta subunit